MRTEDHTASAVMRMFCAALMLLLGFAHQPMQVAVPSPYDEAYRLPDGSFADICMDGGQGDGHEPPAGRPFCEVCRLASSLLMPLPDEANWLPRPTAFLINPPGEAEQVFGLTSVARANSRAPPFAA